jgi:hypothetical protein
MIDLYERHPATKKGTRCNGQRAKVIYILKRGSSSIIGS